uniref:Uncharacterized protein n=1 Tax=Anguilla anguilla TaxID=7936 RepID=A0A0E9WCJ7_ANGAN
MGSFALSVALESLLASPKSLTLATLSTDTRTLRAARSLCTSLLDSRYSIPAQTSSAK